MPSRQFFHEITIACAPESVFDYVTDPNRWNEWFALTLPAKLDAEPQAPGQRFEMKTVQQLFKPLPIKLVRSVQCTICKSDRPYLWEVAAESGLVSTITSYTLSRADEGTILKRQFSYTTKGWLRYAEPVLFRRRIVSQAQKSLYRLKDKVEHSCR